MKTDYTYQEGLEYGLTREDPRGQTVGAYSRLVEAVQANRTWRRASTDHGHTSYWGVRHIRAAGRIVPGNSRRRYGRRDHGGHSD